MQFGFTTLVVDKWLGKGDTVPGIGIHSLSSILGLGGPTTTNTDTVSVALASVKFGYTSYS